LQSFLVAKGKQDGHEQFDVASTVHSGNLVKRREFVGIETFAAPDQQMVQFPVPILVEWKKKGMGVVFLPAFSIGTFSAEGGGDKRFVAFDELVFAHRGSPEGIGNEDGSLGVGQHGRVEFEKNPSRFDGVRLPVRGAGNWRRDRARVGNPSRPRRINHFFLSERRGFDGQFLEEFRPADIGDQYPDGFASGGDFLMKRSAVGMNA
jgi:hypothetical protein